MHKYLINIIFVSLGLCAITYFMGCAEHNVDDSNDSAAASSATDQASQKASNQVANTAIKVEEAIQNLPSEALPGGGTTFIEFNPLSTSSTEAFSKPFGNLSSDERLQFAVGNSFFTNPWVTAPASTAGRDGLGPLFNAAACQDCHIRDGRGHPPNRPEQFITSAVIRIATPDGQPDPVYGTHIQTRSIAGLSPEATVAVHWEYSTITLPDGESIELRKPRVVASDWAYGAPQENLQLSLRVAPPMIGMSLLEAIPTADIHRYAEQQSALNLRGIPQQTQSITTQTITLGRFGWKATQPTVRQQALDAFVNDIGITSSLFPNDACTSTQTCQAFPQGGHPELTDKIETAVVFYAGHLAPPARRQINQPSVLAGQQLFQDIGCAGCHKPSWRTGQAGLEGKASLESEASLESKSGISSAAANQLIWPYTDLLLHDMGAELADQLPEGQASGRHWRTAPLWGLGHTKTVGSELTGYLHDGRARSIREAILWHGGEAQAARDAWAKLNKSQRLEVLTFLKSL